ncbi:MAG: hypothetical protein CMB11_04775 [Euryarchaeota archaeon]|nr:hypothetical protein [Euryarchaeota archaeon]
MRRGEIRMFNCPLSNESVANRQRFPPMVQQVAGLGYPKPALIANRKTRCELCNLVVWQQFSWCELPCPRGGVSPACWNVCIFCGAMRCDPPPVIRDTRSLQPCICDYPSGERGWLDAQAKAAVRCARSVRTCDMQPRGG